MEESKAIGPVGGELAVALELPEIRADFDAVREKVARMVEPYAGVTDETAAQMDLKEAKACRADLKRISKELNDARKAVKKAWNGPLEKFEERVAEIDAMIKAPCEVIDRAVKAAEEAERAGREERLRGVYEEFAPALALTQPGAEGPVLPFERIVERQWLTKSFGEKKAENALCEKVAGITADYASLKPALAGMRFPEECEREFWRTLSLRAVHELDAALCDEQGRIDAMRAEVGSYGQPAKPPEFEEVAVYVLVLEMTPSQRDRVIAAVKAEGVHGIPLSTRCAGLREAADAIKGVLNAQAR